ncbi:DUF4149 domain-containing protein [Massilia sp. R2A-15]|uniref:DUF4149 domain-containing protein n=1 Tax=Massilia sp. R2A-15 TaxID=3064278 RepID=UPI0027363CEA|nr:DUF4149 domain-containing protein [Massilia sp. R2A-15]WLI90635.1 DUF4149 domain-containing protein [Massilia sp. R2A-15]
MLASRARLLVASLWAGSLWTIGYVVAPTLFATLHDNVLVGTIVGSLLRTEFMLTIPCAGLLQVLLKLSPPENKRTINVLIGAMMLCGAAIFLGFQPMMAQVKAQAGAAGLAETNFGLLHGLSQLVYLVESVLAGVLLVKLR